MNCIPLFRTDVAQVMVVVAVLVLAVPGGVVTRAAQAGVRARGSASVEGQAVPRFGAARPEPQTTPQPETQRGTQPAPPSAAPTEPQSRRVEIPSATAVTRTVPPVVTPPQTDHPVYRPDYRPNYRPDYRPQYQLNYRPPYRPEYRPYYRPYYTFLPRVRLGFGLWVGHPVMYPTYFYPYVSYPYAYTYPYPNTAPYPTSIYPVPGTAASAVWAAGGLSFEIRPPEAGVYVDGQYVGTVGQFTPNQPPLSLAPGRHHVEIREPGFEIVAFDVDIIPGQVIPYQGDLRRF